MAVFTIEEAEVLLPRIRRLTEDAAARVQELIEQAAECEQGDARRTELAEKARAAVDDWAKSVTALGAEAKGLWLVDFDNGAGYYCWKFPEMSVDYQHSYEVGFRGRELIAPNTLH